VRVNCIWIIGAKNMRLNPRAIAEIGNCRSIVSSFVSVAIASAALSSCNIPEAGALIGHENKRELFYAVIRGVQCEIRKAVYQQVNGQEGAKLDWLRQWSALMHFTFTFDTNASFNPGVSFITPNLPYAHLWRAPDVFRDPTFTQPENIAQNYVFDVGASASGGEKRVEDVEFFYPFTKEFFLIAEQDVKNQRGCYHLGGFTIGGDLRLAEWLDDVLEPIKRCAFLGVPTSSPSVTVPLVGFNLGSEREAEERECPDTPVRMQGNSPDAPLRTLSHEVIFTIRFAAHGTPQWTLVRITTQASGEGFMFGGSRQDIFDLKITMGLPQRKDEFARKGKGDRVHYLQSRAYQPSDEMTYRDLSLQIGAAVRDGFNR
jgi:hypothetical protein